MEDETPEYLVRRFRDVLRERSDFDVTSMFLDMSPYTRTYLAKAVGIIGDTPEAEMDFAHLEIPMQVQKVLQWRAVQQRTSAADAVFTNEEKLWITTEVRKQVERFLERLHTNNNAGMMNAALKLDSILVAMKLILEGRARLHKEIFPIEDAPLGDDQ